MSEFGSDRHDRPSVPPVSDKGSGTSSGPFISDPDFTLYVGDVRDVLADMPDESVHCVVTSPPYWGLRDYGTGTWEGGEADCDHTPERRGGRFASTVSAKQARNTGSGTASDRECPCGATRTDRQLGLEPTPDEYVAAMVGVFSELRRVLRKDGTCWLNLGDSYVSTAPGTANHSQTMNSFVDDWRGAEQVRPQTPIGLKAKDLVGIPWRLAFALQADGWYLRSDIIWAKPNPMPESVTDRPTKAHEYVFLLTKSPRYFYDADAISEPARWYGPNGQPKEGPHAGQMRGRAGKGHTPASWEDRKAAGAGPGNVGRSETYQGGVHGEGVSHELGDGLTRNARTIWTIQTQQYADAHFAVYPEELPRRCIAAGTSERGCCPECGAPWVREVERGPQAPEPEHRHPEKRLEPHQAGNVGEGNMGFRASRLSGQEMARWRAEHPDKTIGWSPSCAHGKPPTPCVVLDPFMGSGTTALVARRLGRRSIGVELNPEYAQLAARRLSQLSLLAEEATA